MLLQNKVARRLAGLAVAVASFSLVMSGCSGSVDKAGGAVPEPTRTLKLLNTRFSLEVEPFAEEVAKLSAGTLVVDLGEQFERGSADSEIDAIKAVQAGRTDLAVVSVRAFDAVGVRSFDALVAPMEIDSMSLQQKVLSSDIARDMVSGVDGQGLKGIGLLPGPIRLAAGITRPLRAPKDFSGARIAFSPSEVAEHSLLTLGATPVKSAFEGADMSSYDGLEQQVASIAGNKYDGVVKWITANVQLWPRSLAVIANADSFGSLTDSQRTWLVTAIENAIPATTALQMNTEELGILCRRGKAEMIKASPAEIEQFRDGFAPVYQWLRQDASTAQYLDQIDALKAGVAADPSDVLDCPRSDQSASQAPPDAAHAAGLAIDGNYLVKLTASDLRASGMEEGDVVVENYGEFRFVFDHGHFAFTQHQSPACTWGYGTFTVTGDKLEMSFIDGGGIAPNHSNDKPGEVFDYTWSSYRGAMKWSAVPDAVSPANWTYKPWQRQRPEPASQFLRKDCPPPDAAFEH